MMGSSWLSKESPVSRTCRSDEKSVDFIDRFHPPCYKIASASLTDDHLLHHTRATGMPLIVSTGMSTVDQIEYLMALDPQHTNCQWVQIPFRLTNATSLTESQLVCWEPGKHKLWMRPKKAGSIQHKPWAAESETVRDKTKGFGFYDALENFRKAEWTGKLLGDDVKARYADLKQGSADRCSRLLGTVVKTPELQFHHEVYNQFLWNQF